MNSQFGLPWLLPAPSDFKVRARAALAADTLDEAEVRKLSAHGLDLSGLETLGKVVQKHRTALIRKAGLAPFRLGIVSSHTMHYVARALPGTALRHNLVLDVVVAQPGQTTQQLLNDESELGNPQIDAILIALDYRALGLAEPQLTLEEAEITMRGAIDHVAELAAGVRNGVGTRCILQTLVPPASPLFGSFDARVPGSARAMIERFNERLVYEVLQEGDLVLDAAFLASTVGLSAWNDPRDWNKAKLPAALDSTPLYADHICRLLGAARGRARKCVVLGLDNMLWGGIISDDGVDGIRLGKGSSVGQAHVALQRYLLDLRRRGVVLAVCTKEEEANARLPFRAHPAMVLKEDHIAVFCANRSDKATTIREIAATLNIGTDAVVFLDESQADRELVRSALPEAAVPELTEDSADYIGLLSAAGYFEASQFSGDDMNRVSLNRLSGQRTPLQETGSFDDHLKLLDMVATVSHFNAASRTRIAHLIKTSHQFNLTSPRYTERDIEQFEIAPDKYCLQINLADRWGDYGMISAVIFDRESQEWHCDTWLMSSRVLGRRVEELALAAVAQAATGAGVARFVGVYRPTTANALVADHFAKLGFTWRADLPGGASEWVLDLAKYQTPALPFRVVRPNGHYRHTAA